MAVFDEMSEPIWCPPSVRPQAGNLIWMVGDVCGGDHTWVSGERELREREGKGDPPSLGRRGGKVI